VINTSLYSYTDDGGRYNLPAVQPTDSISVSYLGYRTQVISINSRTEINITLQISISSLAQVDVSVSTGYQVLSKERATGSFGKPDMQVFSQRVGSNDIVSRLDGLVPGLTVFSGATRVTPNRNGNGASQQQSLIRGSTTIQVTQQPIYIVNGVKVTDFSAINPNDIADITVLKDAAALAIYGANAANGVIVVTTKSGSAGQIRFNYTGNFNFQGKPDFDYVSRHQLTSSQFIQTAREIFDPTMYPLATLSTSYIAPHETILYNQAAGMITASQAQASLDSLANINNASQIRDLWYRNAYTMNHTVSASGGNPRYNFYSSLSYLDNHSNQIGAASKAYLVNLSQNITPNNWLRLTLNTSLNNTTSESARPINIGANFLPYQLFQDTDGNNLLLNYVQGLSATTRADYQTRSRINLDYSPMDEINGGFNKGNNLNINTSASVGVKIWNGLSFEGVYGYQKAPGTNVSYDDNSLYAQRKLALSFTVAPTAASVPVYNLPITGGRYQTGNNDQRNWTVRNQLIYNTSLFKNKDRLNVQIGQEAQEQLNTRSTTIVRGYDRNLQTYSLLNYAALSQGIVGGVSSFWASLTEQPFTETEDLTRFTSYFGLLNYSLLEKYDFDASIRTDRSNLFAVDVSGQKKPTSSFGVKWQVSKEDFMKDVNWIKGLGLRATYGITGNSPFVGTAATVDILGVRTTSTNGNALSIDTPPNRKLSFEKTQNYNLGVDFSLFNYRLSGNVDLYKKNTTDLLGRMIPNPLNGFESTTGNLGNLTNKGIEVNLRSANIQLKDFNWSTNFVFSYNQNKLVSYSELQAYMLTDSYRMSALYDVGYSSPPLFAYRYAGLDNQGDPQIQLADGTITKKPYESFGGNVTFTGGSYNTFRTQADVNAPLTNDKKLLLRVNTSYTNSGTFQKSDMKNSFFAFTPSLTYNASDRLQFNVEYETFNNRTVGEQLFFYLSPKVLGGIDNMKDLEKAGLDYKQSFIGDELYTTARVNNVFGQINYKINDNIKSSTNINNSHSYSNGFGPYFGAGMVGDQLFVQRYDQGTKDSKKSWFQVQQNFNFDYTFGNGMRNRTVAGFDFLQTKDRSRFIYLKTGAFDTVSANGGDYSGFNGNALGSLYNNPDNLSNYDIDSDLNTYSGYVSNVFTPVTGLNVVLGLRYESNDFEGGKVWINDTDPYNQSAWSPKAGLVYEIVKDKFSVFGNYQNSFKSNGYYTFNTAGETALSDPERANQFEGGFKTNLINGKINATVSYYDIKAKNYLVTTGYFGNIAVQNQTGEIHSKGVELEVNAYLVKGFSLIGGLAYNDTTDESTGLRPATSGSKWLANFNASYQFIDGSLKGLGFGVGGNYASDNKVLNQLDATTGLVDTFTLNSFFVLNANAYYDTKKFRIGVKVDNFTNEHYWIGYSTANPQSLINALGSITYKF
ncbi:MAG: SusC/RagA family TonB-linked outer membrane protein, partial [Chryseobacterium sp.]